MNFKDTLPEKKIGYLLPRTIVENQAYEFYRLAPPGVMLVCYPCGLGEFTAADVSRVMKPLKKMCDQLVQRGVDIILQAGVPLPLLLGPKAHDEMIDEIQQHTGVPAVSQMQNVIAALKHLGLKNVLVVNKWTDEMNRCMAEFFERDGIHMAGVCTKMMTPAEFERIGTGDSAEMAYELGLHGFKTHPKADGLYIGGGSWLSQPVAEQIEAEVGKPVVVNTAATLWDMLRRLGKWKPIPGRGFLLSGS
jgi:maleate isomerase